MAFNQRFHHGANKYSIADAMKPFVHLQPVRQNLIPSNSKDDSIDCKISVSCEELQADVGSKHRSEYQNESNIKFEVDKRIVPSQGWDSNHPLFILPALLFHQHPTGTIYKCRKQDRKHNNPFR